MDPYFRVIYYHRKFRWRMAKISVHHIKRFCHNQQMHWTHPAEPRTKLRGPVSLTFLLCGQIQRQTGDIRKRDLTFQANCLRWRQFAWNVKTCFLGNIRQNSSMCRLLKFYSECQLVLMGVGNQAFFLLKRVINERRQIHVVVARFCNDILSKFTNCLHYKSDIEINIIY